MDRRLVAGCMTGTSIDGIDAALVEIAGRGLQIEAALLCGVSKPLGGLSESLRGLAMGRPATAQEIAAMAREFAALHVEVLRKLKRSGTDRPTIDLVCVHGQTVFHAPPLSWQFMQPAPIARAVRAPVVFDLRAADLAAGGQGAPITPLADYVLFRHPRESRVVVNLGGFCNYTFIPPADGPPNLQLAAIRGGDVCVCNQLLDTVARRVLGCSYDADGRQAARGRVHVPAYEQILPMLAGQSGARRSLGTGDELFSWIDDYAGKCPPCDLARTACAAIAQVIADRIGKADRVLLAGGGLKNRALLAELAGRTAVPAAPTDVHGVPAVYREAACFAVLGALCQDRVPITLPQVTGADPAPVAGAWVYP